MKALKLVCTTLGHEGDDGREIKFRFDRDLTSEDVTAIVRKVSGMDDARVVGIPGLVAALGWALAHAEEREDETDFDAEYTKAHALFLRGRDDALNVVEQDVRLPLEKRGEWCLVHGCASKINGHGVCGPVDYCLHKPPPDSAPKMDVQKNAARYLWMKAHMGLGEMFPLPRDAKPRVRVQLPASDRRTGALEWDVLDADRLDAAIDAQIADSAPEEHKHG